MNIAFDCPDKVSGRITVTIENADIEKDVEQSLKKYRKTYSQPGFRPGMVPMQIVRRQIGASVKMDAVNKAVGKAIDSYIEENKIEYLGEPIPSETQKPVDIEKDDPMVFEFDLAVKPEINIEMGEADNIDFYDITVSDDDVNGYIEQLTSNYGHTADAEACNVALRDIVTAEAVELDADGQPKADGLKKEDAMLMPSEIKDEEQRKLFDGAKVGDVVVAEPAKFNPDNHMEAAYTLGITKEEAEKIDSKFSFTIKKISTYVNAAIDQELFDKLFEPGTVTEESEFRKRISEMIAANFKHQAMVKFATDARKIITEKVGKPVYPVAILRRIVESRRDDNKEPMTDEQMDNELERLTWDLTMDKLASALGVTVTADDLKLGAKQMVVETMARYGITQLPDNVIEERANDYLKERNNAMYISSMMLENKVMTTLQSKVTLNHKTVTSAEFQKLGE